MIQLQSDFTMAVGAVLVFMVLLIAVGLFVLNRILVKKTRETDEELKHNLRMLGNQLVEEFTALLDAMHRDALEKNRLALERLLEAGLGSDRESASGISAKLDSLTYEIKGLKKELARVAELAPDPKRQAEAMSDAAAGIRSQIDRQENLMRRLAEESRWGKAFEERLVKVLDELAELRKRLDELEPSETSAG